MIKKNDNVFYVERETLDALKKFSKLGTLWEPEKNELRSILDQIPQWATVIIAEWKHKWAFGEDVWNLGKGKINVEIEEWCMSGCVEVHKKDLINIFKLKEKAWIN